MALIHVGFFSEALGMCASCDVILPQRASRQIGMAASTRGESGTKHPVLWLLHGASDNHTIWQRRTSIERYAAPLGLAVVMPNAHLSSYEDMAHGGRYYTYISQELPEIMRGFFPLSSAREDNFIAGLSMGGTGCLKIGLKNPDNYAAIGCLSAGLANFNRAIQSMPGWKKRMEITFGDKDAQIVGDEMRARVQSIVDKGENIPRIYHACGTEDFLLDSARSTRDFFESFAGNPFNYIYDEGPGAHTWEFWDEHIQTFLKYIGLEPVEGIRN